MILSRDAGQQQQAAAPSQPHNHEGKQPIYLKTYNHCFSLSIEYTINYMRYSTLYYKIVLVLDNFA